MSLLQRLIEWAGEEGGEEWVKQCLALPTSSCQVEPPGEVPHMSSVQEPSAGMSRRPDDVVVGGGRASSPLEPDEEERLSAEVHRRGASGTSVPDAGSPKRRRVPLRRFSSPTDPQTTSRWTPRSSPFRQESGRTATPDTGQLAEFQTAATQASQAPEQRFHHRSGEEALPLLGNAQELFSTGVPSLCQHRGSSKAEPDKSGELSALSPNVAITSLFQGFLKEFKSIFDA